MMSATVSPGASFLLNHVEHRLCKTPRSANR